ncbi:hypothetical protein [Rathayibacter soli]|uniref:hypothetical protein n=1 Tax=Rathayibacter soli TaxID=3144168 RepID=UPI0027E452B4|nr:hypothetical protein [Glaciibacter superstes]
MEVAAVSVMGSILDQVTCDNGIRHGFIASAQTICERISWRTDFLRALTFSAP